MRKVHKVTESVQSKAGLSRDIYEWAKEFILDYIDEYEGLSTYGADLAYEITEVPNKNGVYEDDAWGFITKHIQDAREEYDNQEDILGEAKNPLKDPDGFVVVWLIDAVGSILANIDIVDENWNNELELTKDVIKEIKDAL